VVVVAALTLGGVAASTVTTAQEDSIAADRTIEQTELSPGETTTVTLEVPLEQSTDVRLVEDFDPEFANVEFVDDDGASFAGAATHELFADYSGVESVTLQYRVTIESDSGGQTFEITSDTSNAAVDAGTDTITVVSDDDDNSDSNGDSDSDGDSSSDGDSDGDSDSDRNSSSDGDSDGDSSSDGDSNADSTEDDSSNVSTDDGDGSLHGILVVVVAIAGIVGAGLARRQK
jgi:hypothetical protein